MEDNNINQENIDQNISQNSVQNAEKLKEISDIYNPQSSNGGENVVLVNRSPIEYYILAFQKYAQFSGRSTRSEYWWFIVGNIIIATVLLFINIDILLNILFLVIFIPYLAVGARRLHDVGKTGWLQLLGIVAELLLPSLVILLALTSGRVQSVQIILIILIIFLLISIIWLFILTIRDSTPGANKYGPNPKGIQA